MVIYSILIMLNIFINVLFDINVKIYIKWKKNEVGDWDKIHI